MSYRSGKTRTKIERILRQDHSDVYFDNERLNDELNGRIEVMQREMLRVDIQRGIEIHKLKKEIHEFKLCRAESRAEARTPDPKHPRRPQTVAGHNKRRRKEAYSTRSQSAWALNAPTPRQPTDDAEGNPIVAEPENPTDSEPKKSVTAESENPTDSEPKKPVAAESENPADFEPKKSVTAESENPTDSEPKKSAAAGPEVTIRTPSAASTVSTLRNTKTLKRYKDIGTSCFKENNRFPEEWYHQCLPASDAALYNARRKARGKSGTSHFNFLQKIRDREEVERSLKSFSAGNRHGNQENGVNGVKTKKMNLICEGPVKPILLSRRRLRELADAKNTVDRAPSRNTVRKQHLDQMCHIERRRMDSKVREFCYEIEELKKRQLRELKEKEEQRRREIQEQKYLQSIELAHLEKSEGHEKSTYEEADEQFDRWHIIA